jgi:hypothetical protein
MIYFKNFDINLKCPKKRKGKLQIFNVKEKHSIKKKKKKLKGQLGN